MVFEMETIAGDDIGRVCEKLYQTVISKKETGYLRFNGFTVMICYDVINYSETMTLENGVKLIAKEDIKWGQYGIIIHKGEQVIVKDQSRASDSSGVTVKTMDDKTFYYFSYQEARLVFTKVT